MHEKVLEFWFDELEPSQWWSKDELLDQTIETRFGAIHDQAKLCELYSWRTSHRGRLAEIIVLDQFSRNIFRGKPESFETDPLALALAQEAIAAGTPSELSPVENSFLYLPFMHSESLAIHQMAEGLHKDNGIELNYQFALRHKEIIEQFGRYPHRNDILGRQSTDAEKEFLKQPGSSF